MEQAMEEQVFEHGVTYKIYQDDDASNPRKEFDNLGKMVCWHRHYNLGDEHSFDNLQEFNDAITDKNAVILPLYLYDHSGITMRTTPFSCPWDSGQVGYTYALIKNIKKEWGWKKFTKARRRQIEEYLRGEVRVYDQYLTGDVWGYVVEDAGGEHLDSCWGFYGIEFCQEEAKQSAEYFVGKISEEIAAQTLEEVGV